jgi:hypothetical protein
MIRINLRNFILSASIIMLVTSGSSGSFGQAVVKQGPPVPAAFCIRPNEKELYLMINDYRKQNNLPPIPLSTSLSYVAALHAKDLFLHHPDQGACNSHSWSNKGVWTPFCYPKDENKKSSVWDKPREMTRYPSRANEIVYWENNPLVTDTVMMVWTTEEYFNDFLLNSGKWQGKTWNAIGIAVYQNYACAWFGEVPDPEGDAVVCGTKKKLTLQDTVKPAVKPVAALPVKPKKGKVAKPVVNKQDSLAIKAADTAYVKATVPASGMQTTPVKPTDSVTGTYYIIVKTSLPAETAGKLVTKLREGDYPDAKVLDRDDKIRVSVFQSSDKATVMAKLKEVKKTYKDAWLLKR